MCFFVPSFSCWTLFFLRHSIIITHVYKTMQYAAMLMYGVKQIFFFDFNYTVFETRKLFNYTDYFCYHHIKKKESSSISSNSSFSIFCPSLFQWICRLFSNENQRISLCGTIVLVLFQCKLMHFICNYTICPSFLPSFHRTLYSIVFTFMVWNVLF